MPEQKQTELLLVPDQLAELFGYESDSLAEAEEKIKEQVARPRANLGGSGPPGRMD